MEQIEAEKSNNTILLALDSRRYFLLHPVGGGLESAFPEI
jgi:hypothetical protein